MSTRTVESYTTTEIELAIKLWRENHLDGNTMSEAEMSTLSRSALIASDIRAFRNFLKQAREQLK